MNRLLAGTVLLAALTIAACGNRGTSTVAQSTPMPPILPGVYAGSWPCSNCDSIEATLWLRGNERFFLRQRLVGGDGAAGRDNTYSVGTWHWDTHAAEIILASVGPERRLEPLDGGALELHTFSNVPYPLARLDGAPPFRDVLRLDGESILVDGGATFTECLSGLKLGVVPGHGLDELRRQQRTLNGSGKPALTTVEGHLSEVGKSGARREVLVVERVIALKPGITCGRS